MSKEHHLKILPEYFNAVRLGEKTFEIRKNDRNYQVGDILLLKEYEGDDFTGNIVRAVVMYITDYAQQDGYVVMSIDLEVESREGWVTKEQLDTPLCDIFEGTKTNRTVREYVIMCEGFLEKKHVILEGMPYESMNRYIDYLTLRIEKVEKIASFISELELAMEKRKGAEVGE